MASTNNLLGSGKAFIESNEPVKSSRVPVFRYHKDCPNGIVVRTEAKLDELDAAGWKDHPGKVKKLPGFEKLYKAETKTEADEEDVDLSALFDKPDIESKIDLSGKKKRSK